MAIEVTTTRDVTPQDVAQATLSKLYVLLNPDALLSQEVVDTAEKLASIYRSIVLPQYGGR